MSVLPQREGVETTAPPDHALVVNRRARHVRIRVTAEDGVVVVVPRRSDVRRVPGLLRDNAAWIQRALDRTADRRAHLASAGDEPLPRRIGLSGIGLAFDVDYRPTCARGVRATQREGTVVVSGAVSDAVACRAALRRWVARAAAEHLPRLLAEVAAQERLTYRSVTVRAQRTRWGSCTRDGRLSLNRSLVFLRPEQVRYVMIHELVHTLRHDHSPTFWSLVAQRVPKATTLRREMREAWKLVPPWACERLG